MPKSRWVFAGDGSWGYGGGSVEKEKGKGTHHAICSNIWCVCGDKEDKIVFWVKGEKRGHARETTTLLTYAGCGLHQKVKKLSAE